MNPLEGDTKRGSERLHRFPGAVSTANEFIPFGNGEGFVRLRGSDIESLQNMPNRLCERFRRGTVSRLHIPIGAKSGAALNPMDQAARLLLAALYREKHTPRPELFFTERNVEIRKRHANGETLEELAKAFGVSVQRIHQIVHRRNR